MYMYVWVCMFVSVVLEYLFFFNESFLIIIKLSKKKIYQYSLISVQTIITVKFEKLAVEMHDGIIYKHSYKRWFEKF